MKLSVIIPAYNECQTIAEVIRRVKTVDLDKEIIVVDDGSSALFSALRAHHRDHQPGVHLHQQDGRSGNRVRLPAGQDRSRQLRGRQPLVAHIWPELVGQPGGRSAAIDQGHRVITEYERRFNKSL